MGRIDLPELLDQPWCPRWLRDAMTGYLEVAIEAGDPYAPAAPTLAALLRETGATRVVDLASGGGGPWRRLHETLRADGITPTVTLTDLHPVTGLDDRLAATPGIVRHPRPVDALDVPAELDGVWTMFTGLHHLPPDAVRALLAQAQRRRVGFAAFDATHRSVAGVLVTLFIPLMVLLLMPRVQPRRPLALLLTYLPPLLPLALWWDGFASTLRTYRATEIERLLDGIREPGYTWTVREVRRGASPLPMLEVVGTPQRAPVASTGDVA